MKIKSLDEVVDTNEVILLDGSARLYSYNKFFELNSKEDINSRLVNDQIKSDNYFFDILIKDNVNIIHEIYTELRNYQSKVLGKINELYTDNKKDETRFLVQNMYNGINSILKLAKDKYIKFDDERLQDLVEIITLVNNEDDITKDPFYSKNEKISDVSYNDIKLFACLLLYANEGKSSGLLTNDRHLLRLGGIIPREIFNPEYFSSNRSNWENLLETGFNIYTLESKNKVKAYTMQDLMKIEAKKNITKSKKKKIKLLLSDFNEMQESLPNRYHMNASSLLVA